MPLPKIPEAQVYEPNMKPNSFSNNLSIPVTSADIEKAANAKFVSENPYKQSEILYNPISSTPVEETLRYNDPSIGYSAFNPDIEQDYADKQTWYSSLGSNLAQGSGRFLATFLGGFSDIPDTVESFKNGLDAFTNTSWKNNLTDWAESLSETFPVYETRYTAEHPYLSFINPLEMKSMVNRWGTVANNLGFTAGAIANAVVTDIALGFATGGYGETLLLPKQASKIVKSIYDLGKSFEAGKSAANLSKILKSPATILQEINQIGKTTKNITAARTALNLYNSAVGQASIEAYNTFKSHKQELINEYKNNYGISPDSNTLQTIDESSQSAANTTFLANTALLIGTNYLTFGKLLKPTSSAFAEAEREVIKNGITRVSGNLDDVVVSASRPKKLMGRLLNSLKTAGTESFEEGSQFTISESSSDYWKNKYYGSDDADQLFKSISKGVQKTLFTREGHENLIMGALSGVLINGFSSVYNGSKARLKGEKYIKNSNKDVETAVNIMNKSAGLTGSISNLHNELSSSLEIEKQYKRAVDSGNIELAKSLKSDLFFNWIHSANQFGRLDLRLAALDDAKLIKDEDFENFWGISYNESNSKTASNYIDLLKKKAIDYKNISDSIEKTFGKNPFNPKTDGLSFRVYNDYKEALAHSLASVKDSNDRISELSSEIYKVLPNLKIDDAIDLVSSKGLGKTSAKLTQKIARLLEAEVNASTLPELRDKIKSERIFLENQLSILDDFRTGKNTDSQKFSKSFSNILKYLNNENISEDFDINDSKIEDIFEKLYAVDYLKSRALDAALFYDTLRQNDGYNKFKNKVSNTLDNIYMKRMDIKDGKLYIKNPESFLVDNLEDDTLVKEIVDKELIEDDQISLDKYNIAIEKLEDGKELTEEEQAIVDAYQKLNEEKTKQVKKEVLETKTEPVSTKIPATSVEVGDVIETMTGPIVVEEVVKTDDVVNKIIGTDVNTKKEVTVLNVSEKPESFTVTVVENNPEVKKNIEINSATTLENLFGNVFTYTETDEDNKLFNEFNAIKAKIEDRNSKFANKLYTKYILNSPIFKFIFGDKMNVKDIFVSVKKSNRDVVDSTPTRITGTSFFRKPSDIDLVLNLNDRPTGFISNINSIYISRNGDFVKLVDAIKDMTLTEYLNLVKDKPETFTTFIKSVQAHKKMSDTLLSYYKEGEVVNVESDVLSQLFKLAPTLVGTKIVNNSNDATLLKDIEAIGDNSYIISARRTFRKTNEGNYSTKFQINVIGKSGVLTEEQISADTALLTLMNDPSWVKSTIANNSRYFLLNRNPDGSFSGLSRIAARPVNAGESKINDLFNILKSKDIPNILDIPSQIYIADGLLPKGNGLFFQFRIDTKTGNVFLDVNKKDYKNNVEQNVISIDLNDIVNDSDNVSEFLNQVNSEISSQKRELTISNLTIDSFKSYIKDDKDVKFDDFLDKLTVATTPYVYNKIKLTVLPTAVSSLEQQPTTSNQSEKNVNESLENTEKVRIFGVDYETNNTLEIAKAKLLVDNIEKILRQLSDNKTITITKCK